LAKVLFKSFPYGDVYKERKARGARLSAVDRAAGKHFDAPGTIIVRRPNATKKQATLTPTGTISKGKSPAIINLFGQDDYGKTADSPMDRER
jgi:hypothetical protein